MYCKNIFCLYHIIKYQHLRCITIETSYISCFGRIPAQHLLERYSKNRGPYRGPRATSVIWGHCILGYFAGMNEVWRRVGPGIVLVSKSWVRPSLLVWKGYYTPVTPRAVFSSADTSCLKMSIWIWWQSVISPNPAIHMHALLSWACICCAWGAGRKLSAGYRPKKTRIGQLKTNCPLPHLSEECRETTIHIRWSACLANIYLMFMACIILVTSRAALTALLIPQILYSSHSQSCIYNSAVFHCFFRYIQ